MVILMGVKRLEGEMDQMLVVEYLDVLLGTSLESLLGKWLGILSKETLLNMVVALTVRNRNSTTHTVL